MSDTIQVRTTRRAEFVDVTSRIEDIVRKSGVASGQCVVFVPHTTAGVTINENADPSVCRDILAKLGEIVPENDRYTHLEGNSDAHIKASMMGFSVTILVESRRLVLGTWQGVYFAEFDGPRSRRMLVRVVGDTT